ncbi:NADH dehydrogenase [ubiquinone] 1 beta subcomplex subunit 10 [Schistosoma japonicum]|nr:NADH dehydrogenase [ubiquinone] 1 beta subcomplex subunit 10 [Schistosoma japonicum]
MGGSSHDESVDVTRESLFREFKPHTGYKIRDIFGSIIDIPVTLFRVHVVDKVRTPYPYYHKRYNRVPTVDQCLTDDFACLEEADQQYRRDRLVDMNIVRILRNSKNQCIQWHKYDHEDVNQFCGPLIADYENAAVNYYIKYGELHHSANVTEVFMKQKHRMLWERRHGPVGQVRKGRSWQQLLKKQLKRKIPFLDYENLAFVDMYRKKSTYSLLVSTLYVYAHANYSNKSDECVLPVSLMYVLDNRSE